MHDVNCFAVAGFYEIEAFISIALLSFYATAKASAFAPDGYFFGADGLRQCEFFRYRKLFR